MKFFALLKADFVHMLTRFPIIIAALAFCAAAFLAALPQGLFENGIGKISVAVVYSGEEEMADMFVGIISDLDPVKRLVKTDAKSANRMLDSGEVDLVIELPSGVIDAMIAGDSSVVRVTAKNIIVANIAYSVTKQAVNTINLLQGRALYYREVSRPYFSGDEEFYRNELSFNTRLMSAALFRGDVIKVERPVPYYNLQLVSILLYLTVSVLSALTALIVSGLFASGVFRRAALHKIPVWQLYSIKMISALALSVPLSLACVVAVSFFSVEVSIPRMIVASLALCALVCPICMLFTAFSGRANTAYARAMLGSLAVLILLFFIGGGFYPVYEMDASLRMFNPAWASHLLAEWVFFEGAQRAVSALQYVLPAAVCAAATIALWRRNPG